MSELAQVEAFLNGIATGLDVMDSKQGGGHERSEFWRGYRYAIDCILGGIDEIRAEKIEGAMEEA
jgi:hypothetical protein